MNAFLSLWRNRRVVVLGYYVGFTGIVCLINWGHPGFGSALLTVCSIVFAVSLIRLSAITKQYYVDGRHWRAPRKVDERQARVRDHALAYSYWVMSSLVVTLLLWTSAAQFGAPLWQPRSTGQWLSTLWIVTTLTSMLPAAIIAWNEPAELDPEPSLAAGQHRLEQ